ncbi:hypothetical protein DRJ22_02320 [Candidatus Woesearchaeota archaeon]|nr:MAG: hypothetical protein B6U93_02650 [Candidatus Woesearchaeota archaeon ex4484_78]RLE46286.1 MAG: hypothetical protein DRJ22_02320 [Candidatus Woesearchaeota archaeon]
MDFRGFLRSRDKKLFFRMIVDQWGAVPDVLRDNEIFQSKDKFYLTNRNVEFIPSGLRVNNLGLYIAEVKKGEIRLSIEGSQLIGPVASKNIFQITDEQLRQWFGGEDLSCDKNFSGFVILRHNDDFLGSGKFKNNVILNFVPKARRVPLD